MINSPTWDHTVKPFVLPTGFDLTLGDISTGSSTPKMVSKVLEWKKAKPAEADSLWKELGAKNDRVTELFSLLEAEHTASPKEYTGLLSLCTSSPASKVCTPAFLVCSGISQSTVSFISFFFFLFI